MVAGEKVGQYERNRSLKLPRTRLNETLLTFFLFPTDISTITPL